MRLLTVAPARHLTMVLRCHLMKGSGCLTKALRMLRCHLKKVRTTLRCRRTKALTNRWSFWDLQ